MTDILRRSLTFNFKRAVVVINGKQVAQTMEVSVTPMTAPSSPSSDSTYVGGVQQQTVLLNNQNNTAVFQLVPSNAPGLTAPVQYLAAWREGGVTGATETQPFAMPDVDCNWDDLTDLGALLGGASFLQETDLGVAGRVTRLNDAGQVVDAGGDPVAMPADVAAVAGQVSAEAVARQHADAQNYNLLATAITQQGNLVLNAAKAYTNALDEEFTAELGNEAGERRDADLILGQQLDTQGATMGDEISALQDTVATQTADIAGKADLDNTGHVLLGQIPPQAITNWVPVPDTAHMLALRYPQDVQPGDVALTPTSIYGLLTTDPSNLGNWRLLNDVLSVNGKTGEVVLTADDVEAVHATNGSLLMSQVTGLSTALTSKADAAVVATLQGQVGGVLADGTYVHTTSGVITNAVMPSNIALISAGGNITRKDGTLVAIGEGSGVSSVNGQSGPVVLHAADVGALAADGVITESQVTGLTTDLGNRVLSSDARLSNARTPSTHAASHGAVGSDPITVSPTQVTGLTTALTTATNNVSSLQTRVTTLEASGPGGYGAGVGIFFDGAAPTGDFVSNIGLHSPFGYNPTNPNANAAGFYFDPAGAAGADVVWPRINVDGSLAFVRLWSGNGADPYYAAANDLTATNAAVAAKASASELSALSTLVDSKASAASVTSLTNTVATKASSGELATTNAMVATKANATDLATTNATVAIKASSADMTTAQGNITALQNTMPTKADLVGGYLKSTQVPTNIPLTSVNGLNSYLAHMNPSGQFDAGSLINLGTLAAGSLSQAAIAGLTASLAGKAGLDTNGKVLASQIPALALNTIFSVTTQAAMLALSTAHPGDVCVISEGINMGTYMLSAADSTQLANWVELQFPTAAVTSVNGSVGTVVLRAADVGAMASNAVVPISQVQNLQSSLDAKANTSALNAAIATVTTPAQVDNILAQSTLNKQAANYAAIAPIASLSGQQSVDGVLVPLGSVVLATAQSSSVNNGLWIVNAGTWTRPTDFVSGTWLVRGTTVVVTQGTNNNNTFWQVTSASGIIDTNANTWANIGSVAPPLVYSNGNGLNQAGQQFSVKPASGGGISVSGAGVAIDPAVGLKKFEQVVAASGSNVVAITHNLNTQRPLVQVFEIASGNLVVLGANVVSANVVNVEFGNPPQANQYAIKVVG